MISSLHLMGEMREATGMRVSELTNLEWRDVDFTAGTICLRQTKAASPRIVAMGPQVRGVLLIAVVLAVPTSPLVFPNDDGRPLRPEMVSRWFRRNGVKTRQEWIAEKRAMGWPVTVFRTLGIKRIDL